VGQFAVRPLITPLYSPLKLRGDEGGLRERRNHSSPSKAEENVGTFYDTRNNKI
jgi:hypothetical protein